jgi:anti-sigma factor RsiW
VTDEELERLAHRLGARAAGQLDVEVTAQAVVERLRARAQATRHPWIWRQPMWLRAAALLAVVIGGGLLMLPGTHRGPVAVPLTTAGAELNDLSTDQLHEVLEALEQPGADNTVSSQDVGLEDLSAPQLRALLESLEG